MKRKTIIAVAVLFLVLQPAEAQKKIVLLHTNDLHSRLTGYAPESQYTPLITGDDATVGGFARIATIIKEEKEVAAKENILPLVVDAGDFLMGTLFQGLEANTGFQLRLMKTMGFDVSCIGNHEFDYGPAKLAEIIENSKKGGEIPDILLSNAVFDKNDTDDDELEKLFIEEDIRRKQIIEREGFRIGFFSLMGKVADDNAAFAVPVTFENQIRVARKMVKELKKDECDLIICLSHSGVTPGKNGIIGGEDVKLAKKVKGIDIIVSGHTHTKLEKPVIINNTAIIQTGEYGRFIGKLNLTSDNGKISFDNYSLIPVDDKIPGDTLVNELIEKQKELINELILKPNGMDYERKVVESDFVLECNEQGDFENSNLGPLVADAIHSYINNHSAEGTDISMVATGVIRDRIVPGMQSAPDIFRIMSMGSGNDNIPGYPLARLYVTGKELKRILEILQVAYRNTPANYCFYSGVRVEYDPEKGMLRKIKKIEIINSEGGKTRVSFSRKDNTLYSITANSYMLEFIGIIKKMSFGLINVVPKDIEGHPISDMSKAIIDIDGEKEGVQEGKEWLALMEYMSAMKDTNGNGIPDIDERYSTSIKSFIPVKQK